MAPFTVVNEDVRSISHFLREGARAVLTWKSGHYFGELLFRQILAPMLMRQSMEAVGSMSLIFYVKGPRAVRTWKFKHYFYALLIRRQGGGWNGFFV